MVETEVFLQFIVKSIPANLNLAREHRHIIFKNTQLRSRCTDINQSNSVEHLFCIQGAVDIFYGKTPYIQHYRLKAALSDNSRVLIDQLASGSDEHHFHLALVGRIRTDNLVIEVYIGDIKWDVLFSLPLNGCI